MTQELQNVLVVDAKNSTRPMSPKYEGQSSSDIAKFFDKISYTKGKIKTCEYYYWDRSIMHS